MCISSITKTFKPNNNNMKIGYKIFKKYNRSDGPAYTNIYFDAYDVKKMGDSYTAEARRFSNEMTTDGRRYEPLFHIFSSLDGTKKWCESIPLELFKQKRYTICKIIAWDIRLIGIQAVAWMPLEGTHRKVPCFISKHYRLMEEIPWHR